MNTKPHQSYGISSAATGTFFRSCVGYRYRLLASTLALPSSRHRTFPRRVAHARKKCKPQANQRRLKANDLPASGQASSVSGHTHCVQIDTHLENRRTALHAC
jgi:hypothetical protein